DRIRPPKTILAGELWLRIPCCETDSPQAYNCPAFEVERSSADPNESEDSFRPAYASRSRTSVPFRFSDGRAHFLGKLRMLGGLRMRANFLARLLGTASRANRCHAAAASPRRSSSLCAPAPILLGPALLTGFDAGANFFETQSEKPDMYPAGREC